MAKRFSVETALQMFFEETEGFDGDAEEIVSESEDNISENSESDTEFEEEDQNQPAPKRRRASGLALQQPGQACEQPASGPARKQLAPRPADAQQAAGPAGEQPAIEPAIEQPDIGLDCQQLANDNIWMSKNGRIEWSTCSRNEPPRMAANVIRMLPGPTRLAVTHAQDIKSSFDLFMPSPTKRIILDCTNLEGSKVFGERWKVMDETGLDAYFWGSHPCWCFQVQWGGH